MPLDHLLRHGVLAPSLGGVLLVLLLRGRAAGRWPWWSAPLFAAAILGALAWNPNFPIAAPWRSAESLLAWSPLLWGLTAALPPALAPAGWSAAALLVSARTFLDVAEYYGWSRPALAGLVALSAAAGAGSAWLTRAVARKHPAPAALTAWTVVAAGAGLALLLGRTAKGAEFAGVLAAALAPPLLYAFARGRAGDASAWAPVFAGAVHAVLLFGLLQAETLWISAAMLVVIAPAAGLITLRDPRPGSRAAGVALVTFLPVAAAGFLAWFQSEASRGSGSLPY